MLQRSLAAAWLLVILSATEAASLVREHVHVVGSSTAYPIVTAAAEHFGRTQELPTPVIESTGTGGGFKLFCAGKGPQTPDVVMASRAMKQSERENCAAHEVGGIEEIRIGHDGIVFAHRSPANHLDLNSNEVYRALARWIPSRSGGLIRNPYRTWRQINPALPDQPILVYGPPPTSGTRDILVERLLTKACLNEPVMAELRAQDIESFYRQCQTLREDGAYINAGENDANLLRRLVNTPEALGILGFNFLDQNRDLIRAASIDGEQPDFDSIESGAYSLTRPLYLYLKTDHLGRVNGLREFIDHITADASIGPDGWLMEKGLIPLRPHEAGRTGN